MDSKQKEPTIEVPVTLFKNVLKIINPNGEADRRILNEFAYLLKKYNIDNDEVIQKTLKHIKPESQSNKWDTSPNEIIVEPE